MALRFVVGLGNPGAAYEGSRHNVGFAVLDALRQAARLPEWRPWQQVAISRGRLAGVETLLLKPQTFMNLSGEAAGPLLRFYQADVAELIVVHDELDLLPGVVRLKQGGGDAGHRGLQSLSRHLSADYLRVRVGIGRPPASRPTADYVLAQPRGDEQPLLQEAQIAAMLAVEAILEHGLSAAMNRTNRR